VCNCLSFIDGFTGLIKDADGIDAVAAPNYFALSSFEVYAFRYSAFLELNDEIKAVIDETTYDSSMTANERLALLDDTNDFVVEFLNSDGTTPTNLQVFVDETDMTSSLVNNKLTLTNVTKDCVITVHSSADKYFAVQFDTNGGTAVSPVFVKSGVLIPKPSVDPLKVYYEFDDLLTS